MSLELSQVGELVVHGFDTSCFGCVATPLHSLRRRDAPGSQDKVMDTDLTGAKASGNQI